jgi:hypothetical protein
MQGAKEPILSCSYSVLAEHAGNLSQILAGLKFDSRVRFPACTDPHPIPTPVKQPGSCYGQLLLFFSAPWARFPPSVKI